MATKKTGRKAAKKSAGSKVVTKHPREHVESSDVMTPPEQPIEHAPAEDIKPAA